MIGRVVCSLIQILASARGIDGQPLSLSLSLSVSLSLSLSLSLYLSISLSLTHTHTHIHSICVRSSQRVCDTHARTHTYTHTYAHTRTHSDTHLRLDTQMITIGAAGAGRQRSRIAIQKQVGPKGGDGGPLRNPGR
jgi:hypothetical protein